MTKTGCPSTSLCTHPDRYLFAACEALARMGVSKRMAVQMAWALFNGWITKPADKCRAPMDFDKQCDRMRAIIKRHSAKPADRAWLQLWARSSRLLYPIIKRHLRARR